MTKRVENGYALDEADVRALLLGRLEGERRERIEARLLSDADYGEYVSAIEEELIDDYNTSELSEDDRRRFEQHFLVTDERRKRVGFGLVLARHHARSGAGAAAAAPRSVTPPRVPTGVYYRLAIAAALVATTVAVIALVKLMAVSAEYRTATDRLDGLDRDLQAQIAERDTLRRELELDRATEQVFVVARLQSSQSFRGSGGSFTELSVPSSTAVLALELDLEPSQEGATLASLHDPEGRELYRQAMGGPDDRLGGGGTVELQFPAALLETGDYSVRIRDSQGAELGRYLVRIRRP